FTPASPPPLHGPPPPQVAPMSQLKSAALGFVALALASGPAFAQGDAMAKGAMASDAMAVSKTDALTIKACKARSHDAMMKSAQCQKMAKAHPSAMGAGMAKDGAMAK